MSATSASRILVLCGSMSYTVRRCLEVLVARFNDAQVLIVRHRPPCRPVRRIVRNQWRNLKRHGPAWIPYRLWEAVRARRCGTSSQPVASRGCGTGFQPVASRVGRELTIDALLGSSRCRLMESADLHDESTLAAVAAFRPDVGVSLDCPILRPALFTLPRLGVINLHQGKLPDYRGMPPVFWELYHGQRVQAVTAHLIDAGLDTGPLLGEQTMAMPQHATVRGVRLLVDEMGSQTLVSAVERRLGGTDRPVPQHRPSTDGAGGPNRKPTLLQQRRLQRHLSHRRVGLQTGQRWFKDSSLTLWRWGRGCVDRALTNAGSPPPVVVLLYHRVSDEFRDPVTVGVEQFERQMAYLARHHRVIHLRELIGQGLADGEPATQPSRYQPAASCTRPLVAITFDDGYQDNFAAAAPVLRRLRLPACYFVCPGLMHSSAGLPHDHESLGRAVPLMTSDQVRQLHRWGFDIGAHTDHHVRLSAVDRASARIELLGAKTTLENWLGDPVDLFAYPYGGRKDINTAVLQLIRQAGYRCCCSAFGGMNRVGDDPFAIHRVAIDHHFSMPAFRAALAGWQTRSTRLSRQRGRRRVDDIVGAIPVTAAASPVGMRGGVPATHRMPPPLPGHHLRGGLQGKSS